MKMRSRSEGILVVELAIVLPLILLLTFGVIEYGWLFLKAQQVTNAARQGARVGATPDATNVDVEAAVSTVLTASGMADSGYSLAYLPAGDVGDLESGSTFTVTVTVPYSSVRLVDIPFIPVPENLRASTSMAKEGP
jgi:Flp pilus assembly protein TadG